MSIELGSLCYLHSYEHYLKSGGETVLYVGDLSYSDEHDYKDMGLRWDTWGRFAERSAAYQPWMWNVGNHEVEFLPEVVHYLIITSVKSFHYFLKKLLNLMLLRLC